MSIEKIELKNELTTEEELSDLKEDIGMQDRNFKEQQEFKNKVRLGDKINKLSSEWANTYEVFIWNKRVWSVVKCEAQEWRTAKAMFASAERSPAWFDTDNSTGNVFPNIKAIEEYFAKKSRKITMITTGPTFDAYGSTKLSWVNYDNGESVGTEESINDMTTNGKSIISISWWKIQISHTQEMDDNMLTKLKNNNADIMTMSSMKRNGNINPNASLWQHPYGHSLVQFNDGTRWEVILNNCNATEKQTVMTSLPIARAVYADADAASNYLDGIWIQTSSWLQYSHPDTGDLFIDENVESGEVIRNNMPGIIIYYTE